MAGPNRQGLLPGRAASHHGAVGATEDRKWQEGVRPAFLRSGDSDRHDGVAGPQRLQVSPMCGAVATPTCTCAHGLKAQDVLGNREAGAAGGASAGYGHSMGAEAQRLPTAERETMPRQSAREPGGP